MDADSSIAVTLKSVIDKYASIRIDDRRVDMTSDFDLRKVFNSYILFWGTTS
jgi:hypothetical protein